MLEPGSPLTASPRSDSLASAEQPQSDLDVRHVDGRGHSVGSFVPGWTWTAIVLGALALFAAVIELHYGRRGFMPVDQSVVFDGGWRTVSGQLPFRDYTTPNAITPSLIQGLFFWLFGVSWAVYLAHAAVINALFAMLVYVLLRLCGGDRLTATLYGALSAVVFYPPVGAPFHDQTAFFFTVLAIALAVAGRKTRGVTTRALWAAAPFAVMAAGLSKQTPALMGVVVVIALAVLQRSDVRKAITWLFAGSAASVLAVVGAAMLAGLHWELVRVYFFDLPIATGQARHEVVQTTTWSLAYLAFVFVVLVAAPLLIAQRVRGEPLRLEPDVTLPLALSAGFMLMCAAFMSVTLNDPGEAVPVSFASVGLFQVAAMRASPSWRIAGSIDARLAVGVVIAAGAVAVAAVFDSHVNETRVANNFRYDSRLDESGAPAGLAFMRFQIRGRYAGLHAGDLARVVAYLESAPGNFVLLGDTTILNGLTGKPSVFPALYLSRGLTLPEPGSPELRAFERRLLDRIRAMDVRRVVLERQTWEGVRLADFPLFQSFVDRCGTASRTFGFFEVIELASGGNCTETDARAP